MSSIPPASARRSSYSASTAREANRAAAPPATSGGGESARRLRRASESSSFSSLPPTRSARGNTNRLAELQTQGNAMKVYVRVRPYSERELAQANMSPHSTIRIDVENPAHLTILDPKRNFDPSVTYPFTRCFWSVFERTNDKTNRDRSTSNIVDTVDTYLNGGMNSARRARTPSMVSRAGEAVPAYVGAGSNAAMVNSKVSHPPYASQTEVYQYVGRPILDNTVDGYNGCVFAYGQTGSGKTFTMMGYAPAPAELRRARRQSEQTNAATLEDSKSSFAFDDDGDTAAVPLDTDDGEDVVNKAGLNPIELQGIIPRVCVDLFDSLRRKRKENDTLTYRVETSYYEIYNEKVYDLIRANSEKDLKVGNNPITGPYVDGLASKVVNKEEDVLKVIRKGMQERHTAQTKFNDRSSRSHAILVFNILQIYLDPVGSTTKLESKLNLVDLAGSERAGAAGSDRPEYKEGVNINLSLTVLGRVIDCLAELSRSKSLAVPVPYRDSRLTMLLMDSIGGNSQTSMIATVSPHMINFEEMKQTLRYASRAKQIMNRAVRNEDPQVVYIRELKSEVARLQQLLKEAGGHEFTRDYVLELEERVRQLEKKCAEHETTITRLRAELESAGIHDPTRVNGGADGNGDSQNGFGIRYASESLQLQLDSANREIKKLQKDLLERAGASANAAVLKEQEAKIQTLQDKVDAMQESIHDRDTLLRRYGSFHVPSTTESIFSTFEAKGLAVMRECRSIMAAKGLMLEEAVNKGRVSGLVALNEQRRKHDAVIAELMEQHRRQMAEVESTVAQRDAEHQRKHREQLAAVEARLQGSIATYEQEKRRIGQERDSMRLHYEDLLTKESMTHQEELRKLRATLSTAPADKHKVADALRTSTEEHEKKLRELREELSATRKQSESDAMKLRSQMSADAAKKEAELNEKDRQRREVERQLTTLRQENLKMMAESKRTVKEKQEQLKDITQQQEGLIAVANSVVAAWEADTKPTLDANIATLKTFIADKDGMRQRAKDLAYRGGAAAASARATRPASTPSSATKAIDLDKKERDFKEMLAAMKKSNEDRSATVQRLQQDCYEQQSRIRGLPGGPSTPPPP